MASTSETGHAKNVANFEVLISFCSGYGASYSPSKNALKIPQLQTTLTTEKVHYKLLRLMEQRMKTHAMHVNLH